MFDSLSECRKNQKSSPLRRDRALLTALLLLFGLSLSLSAQEQPRGSWPAEQELLKNVVGPKRCSECHEFAWKTLRQSQHFKGFKELHKQPLTAKIINSLGGEPRVDKRADCAACHSTNVLDRSDADKPGWLAQSGVSCESCHSPARRWVKIHWKGEGEKLKKNQAKAVKRGFVRPQNLSAMVKRCLDCHSIHDEALLAAGHPGGEGFEMLSWTQGEVRHNFLHEETYGKNLAASKERRVRLYVGGSLLKLAGLIRGFSSFKERGSKAGKRRGRAIVLEYQRLKALRAKMPELKALKTLLAKLNLAKGKASELQKSADEIEKFSQNLMKQYNGAPLPEMDALLPQKVKGRVMEFTDSE